MTSIDVWAGEKPDGGGVQRSLHIESSEEIRLIRSPYILFRLDQKMGGKQPLLDCYLPALTMLAMAERRPLRLHGPVSREALVNIREYQQAWSTWLPLLFRSPIDVEVDSIVDDWAPRPMRAIQAFSGGLDAHFTAWTHRVADRQYPLPMDRGVFVHGFDIARNDHKAFNIAVRKARTVLSSIDVELSTIRTNIRQVLRLDWELIHGACVAAALGQFIPDYTVGLIGSSATYSSLRMPWGSNPITDPLMSGSAMRIVHDGAGYSRNDKIRSIATWPLAAENLRVCWRGKNKWENCGVCSKCIRTALGFEVAGAPIPSSLKQDIQPADIAPIAITNYAQLEAFTEIYGLALKSGIRKPWVKAVGKKIDAAQIALDNVVDAKPHYANWMSSRQA